MQWAVWLFFGSKTNGGRVTPTQARGFFGKRGKYPAANPKWGRLTVEINPINVLEENVGEPSNTIQKTVPIGFSRPANRIKQLVANPLGAMTKAAT